MTTRDPEQALTLRPITVGRKSVPADTLVWVFGRSGNLVEVEFKDERDFVADDALVPHPVPRPDLEALRLLDACFGLPDEAFTCEHHDERYFRILRCKAHGRRFLDDVRGGIAMYGRLTLLQESDDGSPGEIWAQYHSVSDDWLNLQGRSL
jgi:hypothetical protein